MNAEALPAALALVAVFAVGARSTFRLWRDYRAIAPYVQRRNRTLGRAFVVVSIVVIVAVGYFSARTFLRLVEVDVPDWLVIVSYFVSFPVLLVPTYLERVWREIGRR